MKQYFKPTIQVIEFEISNFIASSGSSSSGGGYSSSGGSGSPYRKPDTTYRKPDRSPYSKGE